MKDQDICYRPHFVFNATHGGIPNRAHPSVESATDEAKRLATQNPGCRFIVLAPVAAVKVDLTEPTIEPISG